ncbi:HEAT repeat domain-containing protein [Streptomyces sp. NPDC091268]|uniref:HEAT repeat domain-containing protein n=1 Tax=Streptomyces sp. NPDC091268 TaxID=3365979 RepID=UPI003800A1DE
MRRLPEHSVHHVALRLCHRDGRIRASALGEAKAPLALVAIRTADRAPPVRERARRVLDGALAAAPADTQAALTPLVLLLGRREHGAWALERFGALLRGEPRVLEELAAGADLPARRFAARLLLERGAFGVRELARRAAAERDPVTARLWTDATLAVLAADGPDDTAVDVLLGGRDHLVRAAGVTALRGAGRSAEAARHLADRAGTVRACARRLWGQAGGDPAAHYLELLADPGRVTPYAVTGFAECARRAQAPLLRGLLEHSDAAVRAAVLAGLRRLDDATGVGVLLPLLDDPSASVVREAARSLAPDAGRLPVELLADRLAAGRPPATRRAAYRLLRERGGVTALRASVRLLSDPDPALRRLGGQHIQGM